MKFMVILKGDKHCDPMSMSQSMLAEMARYNRSLVRAGILLASEELHPSAHGARVERSNGRSTVMYGPFAEPGGLMTGFWIWSVPSLREAVEWAKRCPLIEQGDARFVIRRLYDFGDFGAADTPNVEECGEPLVAA
jgi:hypothetical protein